MAHGGLAQAGKVKGQTPKVEPNADKKKKLTGRANQRRKYDHAVAEGRFDPNTRYRANQNKKPT